MTANPIPQPDAEMIAELRTGTRHERLCQGREYVCACGADKRADEIASRTANRLSALVAENERLSGALVVIALGTTDQEPPFRGFDLNKAREIAATGLRVKVR